MKNFQYLFIYLLIDYTNLSISFRIWHKVILKQIRAFLNSPRLVEEPSQL